MFGASKEHAKPDPESIMSKLRELGTQVHMVLQDKSSVKSTTDSSPVKDAAFMMIGLALVTKLVAAVSQTRHDSLKITRLSRDGNFGVTGGKTTVHHASAKTSTTDMRELKVICQDPNAFIATMGNTIATGTHPLLSWVPLFFYLQVKTYDNTISGWANVRKALKSENLFVIIFSLVKTMLTCSASHMATACIICAWYGVPLLFGKSSASVPFCGILASNTSWSLIPGWPTITRW